MSAEIKNRSALHEILKGSLVATLLSVLFVLLFALIARLAGIAVETVPAVNTAIKIISVFLAVMLSVKTPVGCYLKGLGIGLGFAVLSNIIFGLLGGSFSFAGLITDVAIACAVGLVAGIIAVNRKKQ